MLAAFVSIPGARVNTPLTVIAGRGGDSEHRAFGQPQGDPTSGKRVLQGRPHAVRTVVEPCQCASVTVTLGLSATFRLRPRRSHHVVSFADRDPGDAFTHPGFRRRAAGSTSPRSAASRADRPRYSTGACAMKAKREKEVEAMWPNVEQRRQERLRVRGDQRRLRRAISSSSPVSKWRATSRSWKIVDRPNQRSTTARRKRDR